MRGRTPLETDIGCCSVAALRQLAARLALRLTGPPRPVETSSLGTSLLLKPDGKALATRADRICPSPVGLYCN